MRVLVAIPVFNEAKYVSRVISEVRRLTDHVLVVDDGSTDATGRILAGMRGIDLIRHADNCGYGQSLIDAFHFAHGQRYEWIITLDCDDQHEPARIPMFIERARRDDADVVSGSRYLMEMAVNTTAPMDRRRINAQITRMLNRILGLRLTDAFCGFKACRVEAMAKLPLTEPGYAFPLQFWVLASSNGLRTCEVPVPLIYNDPNRHFGGVLDDPKARLRHYLNVFRRSLAEAAMPTEMQARAARLRVGG